MPLVFGYGSLVDRESLEASLGRAVEAADGPYPARLRGFRRCWNVAGPTSLRPDYRFTLADGTQWHGSLGWLGIEAAHGSSAVGAVYRVSETDWTVLDRREFGYDRIDVTAATDTVPQLAGELIFTYRPKPMAIEHAAHAGSSAAVSRRYLRLVDRAFRALGPEFYAEHVRTLPDPAPFVVTEITSTPVDPDVRSIAVDPARR